jgi:hypothetical protein
MDFTTIVGLIFLAVLGVYALVRLGSAAWFQSKIDYEKRFPNDRSKQPLTRK